jgi:tRNA threonylcarbamoyladenosine biosynthesis protein TsaE
MIIELSDLDATMAFGRKLGVALIGPLGAGKTHLSRAIVEGLGVGDSRVVTSPTFVLVQEYRGGRLPVFHFDAYRLEGEAEFAELGGEEYYRAAGGCLIEWADRVAGAMPADRLELTLEPTGPNSRRLMVEGSGREYVGLVGRLA